MNRKEITEEVNQKWFYGTAFAGAAYDPEFQKIAKRLMSSVYRIPQDAQCNFLYWKLSAHTKISRLGTHQGPSLNIFIASHIIPAVSLCNDK